MSKTNNPCKSCGQVCPAGCCKAWQDWWIQNWNDNIHRNVPTVPKKVWRYEHPDRVRETKPKDPEEMTAAEWLAAQMEERNAQ